MMVMLMILQTITRSILPVLMFITWACALATEALADEVETENVTARYQVTYNTQSHPAFRSPYAAVNSLTSAADRMFTFSATAHWGARVWEGGEIYINPEFAAGVPFSGSLVGFGGFTNGEITRAGGPQPRPYLQRLFLRQTWNQGGEREAVEADFNQMAGKVDQNRFVLTAGNFSTLDVFDDNAYAKDPRTQFMNWGNWTYAAYDYAADARGFGVGVAAEWYRKDWVFRLARMSGPREPNGLQIDYALAQHYGDQFEVERSHTLGDQPGKFRVLAWRNRAVLANFNDATAYLKAHPGTNPQSFFNVRKGEQIKYGLGVNLEQALNPTLGFFLRAMQADGRSETYAFTEVDDSISTGVRLAGKLWGRADDVVGLAWLRNGLSKERRSFLEAGGISYFIGDGQIRYQPEKIVEAFYSWQVLKGTWLTADVQHIQNPAYNASRGPLTVYALRAHAEF